MEASNCLFSSFDALWGNYYSYYSLDQGIISKPEQREKRIFFFGYCTQQNNTLTVEND